MVSIIPKKLFLQGNISKYLIYTLSKFNFSRCQRYNLKNHLQQTLIHVIFSDKSVLF